MKNPVHTFDAAYEWDFHVDVLIASSLDIVLRKIDWNVFNNVEYKFTDILFGCHVKTQFDLFESSILVNFYGCVDCVGRKRIYNLNQNRKWKSG